MPHVKLSMYPGRTEAQKQAIAKKITEDIVEILGSKEASISVVIEEIEPDNWTSEIVEKEIKPKEDTLYKKPGYKY